MGTSGSDYGTASISNLLARLALVCSMSEGLPLSSSDKVGKLLDLYFRKKKNLLSGSRNRHFAYFPRKRILFIQVDLFALKCLRVDFDNFVGCFKI